jgi:hypothetical protein
MASADLSRRVEKVVGYPPLVDMDDRLRREFHEALLDADSFEDLRELHRLALREAVAVGQPGWGGGSTASQGGEAATAVSERSPSIGPTAGLEANARSARRDTEAGGTRRGHTCCPGPVALRHLRRRDVAGHEAEERRHLRGPRERDAVRAHCTQSGYENLT